MSKMATTGLQLEDIKTSQTGLDREGLATRAQSLTAPSPSTTPVSADQLGTAQAIKLPKPSTDTTLADGVVAGAEAGTKSTQDYIKELTPPETETSKGYNDLLGQINTLLPGMANKSADQLKAEKEQNIPKLKQDLAGLNAQITTRVAQYNKQVTGEGLASGETPLPVVMGRQAVIQRNQAADVGLLQARALGLQGQVEAAQETANRAIDLKYDTLKDTLDVKMEQLKLLQPILDKEERTFAQALERKYTQEQAKIEETKAKAKEYVNLAFTANVQSKFGNKQGEFFRVSDGKPYDNIQEFFKDAGVSSFEQAYQRGLVTDISAETLADVDFVSQLRNKYYDAGISLSDSAQTAVEKLQNSQMWNAEQVSGGEGFTLSPGQVRYDSAGNIIASGGDAPAKPLTEAQAKDVTYAQRTEESNTYINNLEKDISQYNPVAYKAALVAEGSTLFNGAVDDKIRQSRQAERNFGTAVLRRESGAAISPSEFATMEKQYFPRPGDDEQTLKQKAQNRETAIKNFKASNPNQTGTTQSLQWQDPTTGDTYQFPDEGSLQQFKQENGIAFNSAGNASASTVAPVIQKAYPPGSVGGQCGDFVRKVVTKLGGNYPALGDSLKSKVAAVAKFGTSIANARVGSVVVTRENPTYGHVAYIIGKNAQGWVVAESNFKQSNRVSYGRTIPFNSNKVVGVINPRA